MSLVQLEAGLAGRIELGRERSVNRLGFGAMRITGPGIWGEPDDPDEARRVLRRALELGVELIDTAHAYGPEVSERLIGEALYPYPDELLIATKSGLQRSGPNGWFPDGRLAVTVLDRDDNWGVWAVGGVRPGMRVATGGAGRAVYY